MKRETNPEKNAQHTESPKRLKKPLLIFGGIGLVVILIVVIVATSYIGSLTGLIDRGEVTGDPSFNITDLYITEDTETELNATGSTAESSETTEPAETITQPTIDPDLADAERQQAAALAIDVPSDSRVYNILLIGSDRRAGETTGRSDSMMILSINKRTRQIHLVSLMRGLYVKIPDHGFYMLNAAYSYGGSKLLRQTIEDNFRIHLDDYVMIDFSGFVTAINTVGGVDIRLTAKEAAHLNKNHQTQLVEGTNHLDGRLALEYSRIRKIDSDYARTGRQRKVIEALIKKLAQQSASQLDATMRQLLPLVKTNMSDAKIVNLAVNALQYKNYPISQLMLPVKGSFETIIVSRMQVVKFDFMVNIEKLHEFIFGH